MSLPRQVRERGEQADRLIEEVKASLNPQDPAPVETPAPNEPAPQPVPTATEVAPPQPAPTPAPEAKEERNDWKAKYLVLKGKYDAEVPRLSQMVRELKEAIGTKDREIEQLKQGATPAPAANTAPAVDESQFDPELRALIDARVAAATKPLEVEAETTRRNEHQARWDRFLATVEGEVPDYQTIDADDAFQAWAGEIEPMAGKTRGELLNDAIAALNAGQVVAIYGQFKSAVKGAAVPPPQPEGVVVAPPLEERLVPLSNANAAPVQEKRIFSRKEVADFYANVTRGTYRGREAEAKAIDAEITEAYREGRVA